MELDMRRKVETSEICRGSWSITEQGSGYLAFTHCKGRHHPVKDLAFGAEERPQTEQHCSYANAC